MARGIWILTLALAGVACSSASGSGGGSGTVNGGIGKICAADTDCPSGLGCRVDTQEWISHHQCTTACSTDADCTAQYGSHTECIGAGVCVSKCLDDSDCPAGTVCNENGWCGNTGPGSGVPKCSGSPTPCELLDSTQCIGALGCSGGGCSGSGPSCYSQYSSYSCSAIQGCYWSSSSSSCSGSAFPCDLNSTSASCTGESGCYWSGCSGVQASCESNPASLCQYSPGCALVPQ